MNRNSNKGFSYLEMMVVLGVMAIIIGLVSVSIGLVGRTNALRASEKLETLANKARTSALSRGDKKGVLNIASSGGNIYAYVGESSDDPEFVRSKGELICNDKIEVEIKAGTLLKVKDGVLHVRFKQSSGGLQGGDINVIVKKGNTSSRFRIYGTTGKTERF